MEDHQKLREIIKPYGIDIKLTDNFTYNDPVDKSVAKNQGLRFIFQDNSRVVFRLSGTGSVGATIRIYIEKTVSDQTKVNNTSNEILGDLIEIVEKKIKLQESTGRDRPTVIT
ncbi:Alpha-D-phosphohexomutase-like protein [Cryptosporidium hominis]|nr:Alpha-D-phosphohexomutase-like protein [Cryptosporidium hominis]|eukprot:PPS92164.1 Alpha-D-phosphohexomutase-like protein [Cryptosporidium hominis]